MTVESTPQSITYDCESDVAFPFSFSISEAGDIKVIITDSDGDQTVLDPSLYTVTGTPTQWDISGNAIAWEYSLGGLVTLTTTYSGSSITITTSIDVTQESSFYTGMGNLPKSTEDGLDKLTRILKEFEIRIVALELSIISGTPVTPSTITYLGKVATNPDTSSWGADEMFTVWYNVTEGIAHYWSGSEIRDF